MEIKFSAKDKIRGLKLPNKITSDLAYLCGVFAGDGSFYHNKPKKQFTLKCVGNPKDEKEFYIEVLGPKFKDLFGFLLDIRYHDAKTTFGFVITSKALIYYLTEIIGLPLGSKYDKLRIPLIFNKDPVLAINFIRGVFDTDGCICFKKRYRDYPYYPVISMASKSEQFVRDIANVLKDLSFNIVEIYNYKVMDCRAKRGFTIINKIELNGKNNLNVWLKKIGFFNPKHMGKIKKIAGEGISEHSNSG